MIIFFLFFFLVALPVQAADYTVSSNTAARERALAWEANRSSRTKQAVLQGVIDRYLDDRINRAKDARAEHLLKGYEGASSLDKSTIEGIVGPLP